MKGKLLFVVNVDWFFVSHRLPIAKAALYEGYEVHVATSLTQPSIDLTKLGFVVHPLQLDRKSTGLVDTLRLLHDLFRLFVDVRPDVVHLVTIKPVLLGGLAARWARVKGVVAAVSGLGFIFTARGIVAALRRSVVKVLYRIALGHSNLTVIVQNPSDLRLLRDLTRLSKGRVEMIRGSGVDLDLYQMQAFPPVPPIILMASRLLADKGVGEFVQTARNLYGYKNARFILVGDVDPGNPGSFTTKEIQAWQKEGMVEWWGHQQNMQAVLPKAHVVVLPSYREGLPKILIEAAACGRAVITTDVPGCRDAITDEETGILVPPRDVQALTDAIRRLIDDPTLRERMGVAGRELAESAFNIHHVIERHLAIYRKIISRP